LHHRLRGLDDQMQREQDQAETDQRAADLTGACLLATERAARRTE